MSKEERERAKFLDELKDIFSLNEEAVDVERIVLARSLIGGFENINTEIMDENIAMLLAAMEGIVDPVRVDGSVDEITAYDDPFIRGWVSYFKKNMISHKRKGRIEAVKVMRGEEEEASFTGRIKDALLGGDRV